jgi:hypothetical protein
MHAEEHHHEDLVKGIAAQLKLLLNKSEQAIYIYFDDTHKVCNKKMAEMLGYKSPREWAKTEAPLADVVDEDQPAVIAAYGDATEKMAASCLDVRFTNITTESTVKTRMIITPMIYNDHLFTVHFFSEK